MWSFDGDKIDFGLRLFKLTNFWQLLQYGVDTL